MFFQAGASGLQNVSWDKGLGKGPGSSQVQEGQSGCWLLWLEPSVYYTWWERVLIGPLAAKPVGPPSIRQSSGLETGLTGSLAG